MFHTKYLIIILAFILHKTDSEYQKLNVTAKGKIYSKFTGVYENTNKHENGHVYYKKSDGMEAYVYFNKKSMWAIGKSLKTETMGHKTLGKDDPPESGWSPTKASICVKGIRIHTSESTFASLNISSTKESIKFKSLMGLYEKTNEMKNGHQYYKKLGGKGYVYRQEDGRWAIGESLNKEVLGIMDNDIKDPPEKGWRPYKGGGKWDGAIKSIHVQGVKEKGTHTLRTFPELVISKNGTNINFFGELINVSIFAAGCSGAAIVLEIFLCGFCIYCVKRRKSKKKMRKILEMEANNKDVSTSFPHVLLVKDKDLKENSVAYAADIENLKMEFRLLVRYVERNVPPGLSFSDGMQPNNFEHHNRYKDILPFNHNRIILSKDLGEPPTTYINASKITFYGLKQDFYAVMAPKVNSIQNFWQLVIDKQIGIIVMITALKEGNKTKSAQYWPDKNNANIELANCKLKYESHTYPGTYFHRKMSLDAGEGARTVHQLQTNAWKDKTAPSRSKILLDLVYKTQELVEENPGPILVHCSAGVGRSGTFLALYKLADDYSNHNVQVLDIANTVLEMRRQRVKMVQKKEQYVYIAQCLSHYISAQEAEYQEA